MIPPHVTDTICSPHHLKMNYYIIFPSANPFVVSTGAGVTRTAHSATMIGAASFSAIFSNMFHSFLLSKEAKGNKSSSSNISFFRLPLILSSLVPIFGNVLYAIAMYRNSIPMVRMLQIQSLRLSSNF